MIAEADVATATTVLITALSGTCATLSGVVVYLFKLLMKEKDARIRAAIDTKADNGDSDE